MMDQSQDGEHAETAPERVEVSPTERRSGPWGFWATIGFSLVIAFGYFMTQVVLATAAVILAAWRTDNFDIDQFGQDLASNGLFWSVAICVGAPVLVGLTVLFASTAGGITARDYLALHWPGWNAIIKWCLVVLLFIAGVDSISYLLQGYVVPPLLEQVYQTAYFAPFLWFAFVLVAPFTEELFIRGFLFQGLAHSRLGPAGAIILSSVVWSILHTQYDYYGVAAIFLGGLLLGYARLRSGSVYVPVAMHMVQNVVASLEVVVSLRTP